MAQRQPKWTNGRKQRSQKSSNVYMEAWYMTELLPKICGEGRDGPIYGDVTFGYLNGKTIIQGSCFTANVTIN